MKSLSDLGFFQKLAHRQISLLRCFRPLTSHEVDFRRRNREISSATRARFAQSLTQALSKFSQEERNDH